MGGNVHLRLARPLLERRDCIVDLLIDLALVGHCASRVVVDLVEPALWIAVAHEAHLLRLELPSGALDAVNEEDGVLLEARLGLRLGPGSRRREQKPEHCQSRRDGTQRRCLLHLPPTGCFISPAADRDLRFRYGSVSRTGDRRQWGSNTAPDRATGRAAKPTRRLPKRSKMRALLGARCA